ncbi:gamma carbonic anhydrase family protein [Fictibacillus sp. UD]|uniref:gamma carbonic anhydrase family protein n=1 Tax=Fictibacillus sp. UD TaxID=3038777 RepID=UPI003745F33E
MYYKIGDREPKVHSTSYCAPGSHIIGDVILEEQTTVWFNAVLRGDNDLIQVGKSSNVQDGAIIHVDEGYPVMIGENVTIGHHAILHGCTVKDNALVGMSAVILNGAVIGEGAIVAAGALVPEGKVVEPGTMVAGVPAKTIRNVDDRLSEMITAGAKHYADKGVSYKNHLVSK